MQDLIVLFSGRFDRPHIGHIRTLQMLGQEYKKVIVPVLMGENDRYDICERVRMLAEICSDMPGDFVIYPNRHHFAKVTQKELESYGDFDVYASGNRKCIDHIRNIDAFVYPKCEVLLRFIPRSFDISATEEYERGANAD